MNERTLEISYNNIITKITNKLGSNFKAILKEDQKKDFIKTVDDFMSKQKVSKEEYEVLFQNE